LCFGVATPLSEHIGDWDELIKEFAGAIPSDEARQFALKGYFARTYSEQMSAGIGE